MVASMDRIKKTWDSLWICLLLGAATLAAYSPVVRNDFIELDDYQYVVENPHVVTGLNGENVRWAFRTGYASNWHPLTWLSHMLDVQLFGLNPARHHLISLLFHLANTLLVFLVLKRMTASTWRSGFVAALFGLHPLHVESVAWVAERKDVLSTLFFWLTLWAYARYARGRSSVEAPSSETSKPSPATRRSSFDYWLALIFFALGLMSKPMLVTLPFVLLLLDFWPLRRLQFSTAGSRGLGNLDRGRIQRCLLEKVPFLTLAVASSVITFLVQEKGHSVSGIEGLPMESRLANAAASYLKYLGKTFWPVDLAIFYPHPDLKYPLSNQWPEWQIGLAGLALLAVSVMALLRWRREPWLVTGWFWFLGTLVPVIGIIQVGGQAMADRYTYIPLLGIFICAVWGLADLLREGVLQRAFVGTIGTAIIAACAVTTFHQVRFWRNNRTVSEHALAVTTHNPVAEYSLGKDLGQQGNYDQAIQHFRAAIESDPVYGEAYYCIGLSLSAQGKVADAIEQFQAAVRVKPWYAEAHNSLGAMYWQLGRRVEAMSEYQEALRLKPENPQTHYNLGTALAAEGKVNDAANHFAEAARLRPDYPEARTHLAEMFIKEGKLDAAEAEVRAVAQLYPTNAAMQINLGDMMRLEHKPGQAEAPYSAALRLHPDDAQAHFNLGSVLLEQGQVAGAETNFAATVRLQPQNIAALTGLGRALAAQGKLPEAQLHFQQVVQLCPTNAEAQLDLGNALQVGGHTNEAATVFAAALQLDPELATKVLQAGKSLLEQGQIAAATGRLMTAVWLQPDNAEARQRLGLALAQQGKLDEAVAEFERALLRRPDPQTFYNLALTRVMQGKAKEAVTNYDAALKLRPDWPAALNDLAWLLATHPAPDVRNGAEAVRLAQRACQLSGDSQARFWGTLDAAYAEAGRFTDAISTAEKTRRLALAAAQDQLAQAAQARMELYRKQQPFRQ